MTTLQQSQVNAIQQARANVKFVVSENGPIAQNHSGVQRTLAAGTVYMDAPSFPTITIGPKGGIVVWISSYPEDNGRTAYDAAIKADVLLAKQSARRAAVKVAVPAMVSGPAGFSTPSIAAALANATLPVAVPTPKK